MGWAVNMRFVSPFGPLGFGWGTILFDESKDELSDSKQSHRWEHEVIKTCDEHHVCLVVCSMLTGVSFFSCLT